jgi:alpha-L-fucosidase
VQGNEIPVQDAQVFAAAQSGAVSAVIWDFQQPQQKVSNRPFYSRLVPATPAPSVEVSASHLKPGSYRLKVRRTGYRTAQSMVHLLVEVVSKNGNLLLNIPLPGHRRPDDDEFAFLEKFGAWMALNTEAIYSTRPWKIPGEGPTKSSGQLYGGAAAKFVAGDIRFTAKGDALYAIALAWPGDGKLVINALALNSPDYRGEIARIGLLGSESNLVWSRNADGAR